MKGKDIQQEVRGKVDDFMVQYMGGSAVVEKKKDGLGAMDIVDSWFNPEPQLIKHLIIIQMIASMIVVALMIIVEGQNMNPFEGMVSIVGFMLLAAFTALMYNRF